MNKIFRLERNIIRIEIAVSILMIVAALFISFYTILWRNLGYSTGDWVLELPITLITWAVFVGTGANIASSDHIKTDFFIKFLPLKIKKIVLLIMYIVLLMLFAAIFYYSITATELFIKTHYKLYELFYISFFIVFSVVPFSTVIWCFHIIIKIIQLFRPDLYREKGSLFGESN